MGLYNEVSIKCLQCNKYWVEQTKSGSCEIKLYSHDSVPVEDIQGIPNIRNRIWCEHCGREHIVKNDLRVKVPLIYELTEEK